MPVGRVLLLDLATNPWLTYQRGALQASWSPCQPGWDSTAVTRLLLASTRSPHRCLCPPSSCPSALHVAATWVVGAQLEAPYKLSHDTSWHTAFTFPVPPCPPKPLLQLGSLKGKDCQFLFHNISRAPFWGSGVSWHSRKLSVGVGEGEPHGKLWTSRQALACTQQNLGRQGTRVAFVTPKLYQDELKSGSVTSPSCPVPRPSPPHPPKKKPERCNFLTIWLLSRTEALCLLELSIWSRTVWFFLQHPPPQAP